MRVGRRWLKHHPNVPIAAEDHVDHVLAAFKKAINLGKKAGPRSSCRSRAALTAASAAATLSRPAYRRRPTQQLRQLGEVRRHAPRLIARQPIWSPSGATQRYVWNRGTSGSARLALETMTTGTPFCNPLVDGHKHR
jgi:hypothetical protein